MDALGFYWACQEAVHYPLALCTSHGPPGGRKSSSSVPVSIGFSKKREVRRGFCLLSMPGAAEESQYRGRAPRALCSTVRGGTRRRRITLCSWSFNYSSLASVVFSLSQGALDEDCIGRVIGRQGNERRKKVWKKGPVLRLFAHCKYGARDAKSRRWRRHSCEASWSDLNGADEHGHLFTKPGRASMSST